MGRPMGFNRFISRGLVRCGFISNCFKGKLRDESLVQEFALATNKFLNWSEQNKRSRSSQTLLPLFPPVRISRK